MAGRRPGRVEELERAARASGDAHLHDDVKRQLEHQRTLAQEQRRREVAAFMEREGLKTVDDCRAYVRRKMRAMLHRDGSTAFEAWAESMKQETVERLTITATDDDKRLLARLQRMRVIDEQFKIIPIEQRAELRRKDEEERARIAAELEARRRAAVEYGKKRRGSGAARAR